MSEKEAVPVLSEAQQKEILMAHRTLLGLQLQVRRVQDEFNAAQQKANVTIQTIAKALNVDVEKFILDLDNLVFVPKSEVRLNEVPQPNVHPAS